MPIICHFLSRKLERFAGIDEMLLEEESFPFAESEAHRKIRESYGESLQKMVIRVTQHFFEFCCGLI